MPIDSVYKENTYVFDSENPTKTTRLSFQDRLLARYQQTFIDMLAEVFGSILFLLTVWGEK